MVYQSPILWLIGVSRMDHWRDPGGWRQEDGPESSIVIAFAFIVLGLLEVDIATEMLSTGTADCSGGCFYRAPEKIADKFQIHGGADHDEPF